MSGSARSPWAWVKAPTHYAVVAAEQVGCEIPEDLEHNHERLLSCLRDCTVDQILQVNNNFYYKRLS